MTFQKYKDVLIQDYYLADRMLTKLLKRESLTKSQLQLLHLNQFMILIKVN